MNIALTLYKKIMNYLYLLKIQIFLFINNIFAKKMYRPDTSNNKEYLYKIYDSDTENDYDTLSDDNEYRNNSEKVSNLSNQYKKVDHYNHGSCEHNLEKNGHHRSNSKYLSDLLEILQSIV